MIKLLIDSATFHKHAPMGADGQSAAAAGESKVFLYERVFGTSLNTKNYALGIMRMDPEIMAQMERSHAVSTALHPDACCYLLACMLIEAAKCTGYHIASTS